MGTAPVVEKQVTEAVQLENRIAISADQARALVVKTPEQYQQAAEYLRVIAGLKKEVLDTFTPMKKKAHEAHQEIIRQESKHLKPLNEADAVLRGACSAFTVAQSKLKEAEEQRRQAEANRRQHDEAIAEAERLQAIGKAQEAEHVIEKAAAAPAPVVVLDKQDFVPKVEGMSSRKGKWRHRVTDESKVPREFLCVDEAKLKRYAEAMRDMATVPGCEFYQEDPGITVRA